MDPASKPVGLLSPYRVLDLADEGGILAGKMFADLGADVIAVEPPGGNPVRRQRPFYKNDPHPERSLAWWAYSAGKRSVTLDLESDDGRRDFRLMASTADFIFESYAPGHMEGLGLGYESLRKVNPGLILVSMTPFGQDGPYSGYLSSDLVGLSLGGLVNLTGDADRPPLRPTEPQFGRLTGASGAVGAMAAHHYRTLTGEGQHVDVSGQQAVARVLSEAPATWSFSKVNVMRDGIYRGMARGVTARTTWECTDGYVTYSLTGGGLGAGTNALFRWMEQEGFADTETEAIDWTKQDTRTMSQDVLDRASADVEAFFMAHTKEELYAGMLERRVLFFPVSTPSDILQDAQLQARNYFVEIEHPEEKAKFLYPGSFVKSTAGRVGALRRAPRLGEHNEEFLAESPSTRNPSPTGKSSARRAFEGLKVLDFCWVAIGPLATRYLADHGATVVRVESEKRVETLRGAEPYADGEPGINRSGYFANYNCNKYGITVNLAHPKAKALIGRFVQWADLVTENFTPGTMERRGIGYEDLKRIKPDIIMFSASMLGRGGPHAHQPGYGGLLGSLAGFVNLCGWPDRSPVPPYGAYTDFFLARFALVSIAAAIDYRRRTGKGQHLDLSQLEAALHLIAPAILDYTVNGHEQTRQGNKDPNAAPHGVYPCKGGDRWCAIAVQTEQQWAALRRAMGNPAWCLGEQFASLTGRKEHEEELGRLIGRWTVGYTPEELMGLLQAVGVPAGAVNRCEDLFKDPQLAHRNHYIEMDHPEMGKHTFDGTEFILPASPARYERPTPLLGQHNEYVLKEILGMSDDEVGDLVAEGVLE